MPFPLEPLQCIFRIQFQCIFPNKFEIYVGEAHMALLHVAIDQFFKTSDPTHVFWIECFETLRLNYNSEPVKKCGLFVL